MELHEIRREIARIVANGNYQDDPALTELIAERDRLTKIEREARQSETDVEAYERMLDYFHK